MADVKLNSLATKTNANAAAILVKDSATQNAGAEGWITKAQLSQIIRDEIKAQMSAITSGTPDVPVLDGSTMKYMTLANFAKVVGGQALFMNTPDDLQSISPRGLEVHMYNTGTLPSNAPTGSAARGGCIALGQGSSPKLLIWIDQNRNMWVQASWYGAYSAWAKLI